MNWFYDLEIARKLALGFGLCLVLATAIGGVALSRMAQMNAKAQSVVSSAVAGDIRCGDLNYHTTRFRVSEYRHLASRDISDKSTIERLLQQEQATTQKDLGDYGAALTNDVDKQNWQNTEADWDQYLQLDAQFMTLSNANRTNDATRLMVGPMFTSFNKLHGDIQTMIDFNVKHGETLAGAAQASFVSARATIVTLLLLSMLLGSFVAWLITRYMTQALTQISQRLSCLNTICVENLGIAVAALEGGDLTVKIATGTEPLTIRNKDEFGQMAQTFNRMLAKLQTTITSFRQSQASLSALIQNMQVSAGQVDAAANALAGTSQQISATTEEITATMQEVAEASEQSARGANEVATGSATQAASIATGAEQLKELAAAVRGVTHDTKAATESVELATQAAAAGAQAVEQTVAGMGRIHSAVNESAGVVASLGQTSAQIGGIVQTIDEIAGQTNLLALNAAIEAARAGDAGRGFAVVADEVRKLAERCTVATKDIGNLIGEIQCQTQQAVAAMEQGSREASQGNSLAGEAGAALSRIQSVVSEMSSRVLSIGTAAEGMSASAQEVSATISDVAAVVEESSAAAEEMSASAEQVSASVSTVAGTTAQQGAAVEELVASASEMTDVSQSLNELISRFKVEGAVSQAPAGKPHLTLRKAA